MAAIGEDKVLAGAVAGKRALLRLIEASGQEPEEPTALVLDFKNVEVATASFLRETVFALKTYMRARQSAFYPVVANLNGEIRDELSVLTDAMSDVVVACNIDESGNLSGVGLIGRLDPKQKLTFDYIVEHRMADANTLKRELGDSERTKSTTAWNNRLAGLVARGVVKEFSRGRAKVYKPIFEEVG